jgi:hypothetical protein
MALEIRKQSLKVWKFIDTVNIKDFIPSKFSVNTLDNTVTVIYKDGANSQTYPLSDIELYDLGAGYPFPTFVTIEEFMLKLEQMNCPCFPDITVNSAVTSVNGDIGDVIVDLQSVLDNGGYAESTDGSSNIEIDLENGLFDLNLNDPINNIGTTVTVNKLGKFEVSSQRLDTEPLKRIEIQQNIHDEFDVIVRGNKIHYENDGLKIISRSDGSEIGVITTTDNLTEDRTLTYPDYGGTPTTEEWVLANTPQGDYIGVIVPTDSPTETGANYWNATEPGTYTNFGGVVVNANSFALISRDAAGNFSISQTEIDLSSKASKQVLDSILFPSEEVQGNLYNGYIAKATGIYTANAGWRSTGFIEVTKDTFVTRIGGVITSGSGAAGIAFFDKNYSYLGFSGDVALETTVKVGDFYPTTVYTIVSSVSTTPPIVKLKTDISDLVTLKLPVNSFETITDLASKVKSKYPTLIPSYNSTTSATGVINEVVGDLFRCGGTLDLTTFPNGRLWFGFDIQPANYATADKSYVVIMEGLINATNISEIVLEQSASLNPLNIVSSIVDGVDTNFKVLGTLNYSQGQTSNARYCYLRPIRRDAGIASISYLAEFTTFSIFEEIQGFGIDDYINASLQEIIRPIYTFTEELYNGYADLSLRGVQGYYIHKDTGITTANANYKATGFLPVTESTYINWIGAIITAGSTASIGFFDINQNYLGFLNPTASGSDLQVKTYFPTARFIKVGFRTQVGDTFGLFLKSKVLAENQVATSSYKGKRMISFGHSIVFQGLWQHRLAQILGMTYNQFDTYPSNGILPLGIGGAIIRPVYSNPAIYDFATDGGNANGKQRSSLYYRADEIKNYPHDVLFIMGAQNDAPNATTLGTFSEAPYEGDEVDGTIVPLASQPSFYASIKGMFKKLVTQNPNTKIVYIGLMHNWYYDPIDGVNTDLAGGNRHNIYLAEKAVCEEYSIIYIDCFKKLGVNAYNAGINTPTVTEVYFKADSTESTWISTHSARVHPNQNGGNRLAEVIAAEL